MSQVYVGSVNSLKTFLNSLIIASLVVSSIQSCESVFINICAVAGFSSIFLYEDFGGVFSEIVIMFKNNNKNYVSYKEYMFL
jgi:hypothetical protein